eukprot:Polyplicarium_translucidae@DN5719_c0_g1_i1.p1
MESIIRGTAELSRLLQSGPFDDIMEHDTPHSCPYKILNGLVDAVTLMDMHFRYVVPDADYSFMKKYLLALMPPDYQQYRRLTRANGTAPFASASAQDRCSRRAFSRKLAAGRFTGCRVASASPPVSACHQLSVHV